MIKKPTISRELIEQAVKAFLEAGGKIEKIKPGNANFSAWEGVFEFGSPAVTFRQFNEQQAEAEDIIHRPKYVN